MRNDPLLRAAAARIVTVLGAACEVVKKCGSVEFSAFLEVLHHPVVGLSADQLSAIQASGERRLISEIYRELTARRAAGRFRYQFSKILQSDAGPPAATNCVVIPFPATRRRADRPRIQTDRSRLDPTTIHDAYFSHYYNGVWDDPRVPDCSKVLLMELCVLAADARQPLGYDMAEIAAMWNWPVTQVREDAEACAAAGYLDIIGTTLLLRDPRDRKAPAAEKAAGA